MFAVFSNRIQRIRNTRKQLETSLNSLIESRNELRGFLDKEYATTGEWQEQDFENASKRVDELIKLNSCALQLTKRGNSKLQIAFVGSVGAGKSTLINALLGEDVMPVTRAETTFCNVAITGTSDSQWKALERRSGKTLEITEFKQLLHVLKAKGQRERLGITPSSVIDVQWPTVRCKALVESVVLYDTPGIGERKITDDAVIDLCKAVDVIVAVMDIHSPTLRTVVDFVKAVNCTYTLGVFTKWDLFLGNNFSDEYGDTTADDVKERCIKEFMNAVSDRGRVYFVDSQTHKDPRSHTSHQHQVSSSSSTAGSASKPEGAKGFSDFERTLVETLKGALNFDMLKYDLQNFVAEAKNISAHLSRIIDDTKQQRIHRVSRRIKDVADVETAINGHLSKISDVLLGVMGKLQQDRQMIALKEQIEHDLRNGVSIEQALDRCRDRLNRRLQEMVDNDRELKMQLDDIWSCLSRIADGPDRLSLRVPQPMWTSKDFQVDENFVIGTNVRSWFVNPSFPARMLFWGLLGAALSGYNGGVAILLAVVPVLNRVLPFTDLCAWLGYIWPTSDTEIQAVQNFVITKLRELHEVKCKKVPIDAVKDLRKTSDIRIQGVRQSLYDDLRFVRDEDNILNKQKKITDRLQNSFESYEEKVHNI